MEQGTAAVPEGTHASLVVGACRADAVSSGRRARFPRQRTVQNGKSAGDCAGLTAAVAVAVAVAAAAALSLQRGAGTERGRDAGDWAELGPENCGDGG